MIVVEEPEAAGWIAWDEVLAHPFDPLDWERSTTVTERALSLLRPFLDRPRLSVARVPRWAFALVCGLLVACYEFEEARRVLAWCAAGDEPRVRSQAVLSCFDLGASRARVTELIAPSTEKGFASERKSVIL